MLCNKSYTICGRPVKTKKEFFGIMKEATPTNQLQANQYL